MTHKYICSNSIPENYYLDNGDNIYKECYSSCKKCTQSGNFERNNCVECQDNYRLINEPFSIEKNCYEECSDYYYFNGINLYYCAQFCNNHKLLSLRKNELMIAKMIMNIYKN